MMKDGFLKPFDKRRARRMEGTVVSVAVGQREGGNESIARRLCVRPSEHRRGEHRTEGFY